MKKYFCVSCLFFCFAVTFFANGCKDIDKENENGAKQYKQKENKNSIIQIPKNATLGDFITARFDSKKEITDVCISFFNEKKKREITIKGFPINKEKTKWVVIASIAVWWKPGIWKIKTKLTQDKNIIEDMRPFLVLNKKFPEFVMNLGKRNTKILTERTKKKTKQRNRFVEIICTTNYDAKLCSGPFIEPFKFGRISSYFAEKRIKKYTNGKTHTSRHWGMDYPAPKGTPIVAPADGKVVLAESRVLTGNTVILEHLPGVYTIYYHLNEIYVKEGEFLRQGTKMAAIGSTGFSTGPHLHWELRINGIPTDVRYLLKRNLY